MGLFLSASTRRLSPFPKSSSRTSELHTVMRTSGLILRTTAMTSSKMRRACLKTVATMITNRCGRFRSSAAMKMAVIVDLPAWRIVCTRQKEFMSRARQWLRSMIWTA